jgi:hypothetical protein
MVVLMLMMLQMMMHMKMMMQMLGPGLSQTVHSAPRLLYRSARVK